MIKNIVLFGFPVIITKINSRSYDKKLIISTIEKNFKINKKRNQWDKESVLHHSYNDNTNSKYYKIDYTTLIPVYEKIITEILSNMPLFSKFKFNFTIANYTCLSKCDYMASHIHNSTDFTAVHYIQFDKKNHSATTFENVLPHIDYIQKLRPELSNVLSNHHLNSWSYASWKLDVKENDFCFSPSFLKHKIEPQTSKNKNRITIVLNIFLKGRA